MSFSLTTAQTEIALADLDEGVTGRALAWAEILPRMLTADDERLANALVNAFIRRLRDPARDSPAWQRVSPISYQSHWLGTILNGCARVSSELILDQFELESQRSLESAERDWFLIARGFTGDRSSFSLLEELVSDTAVEVSLRALALEALARGGGRLAIPILERYVEDETPGNGLAKNKRPLACIARDALVDVRRLEVPPDD